MGYAFRPSTLEERKEFYRKEFDIGKVREYFDKKPQFFAIDYGSETKISIDKSKIGKMRIIRPKSFNELKKELIKALPEDVYYDRNYYKNPNRIMHARDIKKYILHHKKNIASQELAFDIDPENIKCPNCTKRNRPLTRVCGYCTKKVLNEGVELVKFLKKEFKFKKIEIVYSGRGCHVIVKDKEAYYLTFNQRARINKKLNRFHIDPWVSHGNIRFLRLPYSLNGLVSRITMPLKIKEVKGFNPLNDKRVIPFFIR